MSNNTEFKWTDELITEFFTKWITDDLRLPEQMKRFKESKQSKPLFKTYDGVDVFEGDRVWFTYEKGTKIDFYDFIDMGERERDLKHHPDKHKYFSTCEAAKEYIIENQPLISLKEIREVGHAEKHNHYYKKLVALAESKLK